MRVSIKIEAFGHTFELEKGDLTKEFKLLNAEITILTIGITVGLFV